MFIDRQKVYHIILGSPPGIEPGTSSEAGEYLNYLTTQLGASYHTEAKQDVNPELIACTFLIINH